MRFALGLVVTLTLGCSQGSPEHDATRAAAPIGVTAIRERLGSAALPSGSEPLREDALGLAMSSSVARLRLPRFGGGEARLRDARSNIEIGFVLVGATSSSAARVDDGLATYEGVFPGATLVHRASAEGTEDYVYFGARPSTEALTYRIDVRRIAGLRLVSSTLEMLDATGTPRLRVAPPSVVDGAGTHSASLAIEGCRVDTSPAPPWGRPTTAPGAAECTLTVRWAGVSYPALVDPRWSTTGSMAGPRTAHASVLLATGKVLVSGGGSTTAELFDSATGTFAATGVMTTARSTHTMTLLGSGQVLVAGGSGSTTAELYDPSTGKFTATGALGFARTDHVAALLGTGKVLVAGGTPLVAELYDPQSGTFSPTGSLASTRNQATIAVLPSGKVLIAGGAFGTGVIAGGDVYDPVAGTFTPSANAMATTRYKATAATLGNGKVLIAGGTNYFKTAFVTADLFDPATLMFTPTGEMQFARKNFTATALPSGNVLVVGGASTSQIQFSTIAETYDFASGTFSVAAASPSGRINHAATLLANGTQVLVTGGTTRIPNNIMDLATAEVIDIAPNGKKCTANDDCETSFCVDGVCCNSQCLGQCEACDVLGKVGTCSPVTGAPHAARAACPSAGTDCGAQCDGVVRNACTYREAGVLCGSSCSGTRETDDTCNGQGSCVRNPSYACDANFACGADRCKTTCVTDPDCAPGYVCGNGGKCVKDAVCSDEHTSQPALGAAVDCTPFRCDTSGRCKKICVSIDDCIAPAVCDTSGRCIVPTEGAAGCASNGADANGSIWALCFVFLATIIHRRARR